MVAVSGRTLPSPSGGHAAPIVVLLGIVLVAFNLRGPIVAPATVSRSLSSALEMNASQLALLTTIPVLCFALAVPLAALIIRYAGPERGLAISMAGVLSGTLLRIGGTNDLAIGGTVVLGIAMTIGNISVPVVLQKYFVRSRIGSATGIYTAALNGGSVIMALGTAPLAALFGWQTALALWGVLAFTAVIPWASIKPGPLRTKEIQVDDIASALPLRRRPTVWLLALAFAGQGFAYFAMTAWLPAILSSFLSIDQTASGASSALFQVSAIGGALAAPLAERFVRPGFLLLAVGCAWGALPGLLLIAPSLWWIGSILGGAGQGAAVTVVFIVVARLASSSSETARVSAVVQFTGYGIGAAGPLLLGALHDVTGSWVWPLLSVLLASAVLGVAGLLAARGLDHS